MKQRAITLPEVEHVLMHPTFVLKHTDGRNESGGTINNRKIRVIFTLQEKHIKVITVI